MNLAEYTHVVGIGVGEKIEVMKIVPYIYNRVCKDLREISMGLVDVILGLPETREYTVFMDGTIMPRQFDSKAEAEEYAKHLDGKFVLEKPIPWETADGIEFFEMTFTHLEAPGVELVLAWDYSLEELVKSDAAV